METTGRGSVVQSATLNHCHWTTVVIQYCVPYLQQEARVLGAAHDPNDGHGGALEHGHRILGRDDLQEVGEEKNKNKKQKKGLWGW